MMNLPNVVVHCMDAWSPLVPHPVDLQLWREPTKPPITNTEAYNPAVDWRFPDPPQRSVDCDQGNREANVDTDVEGGAAYESRAIIEAWLKDTQAEIIVLVEGTDPTTSATIQSRHS